MACNNSILSTRFACVFALCVLCCAAAIHANELKTPEALGLRFDRAPLVDDKGLALRPGGPKERIEVESTTDHIDYVVKTYVLKNANASEVYDLVQQSVSLEGGKISRISAGSTVDVDKNQLECHTKYEGQSMLVVTVPDWLLPYLDKTIEMLDTKDLSASATGTGGIYAPIKYRLPSEVAQMIRDSVGSQYIILKPDDSRQILYLEDTPSYFGCDLEALRNFDTPAPQIQTRIRIYEIQEQNTRDVGLDWDAWKSSIKGGGLDLLWSNAHAGSFHMDPQSVSAELSLSPQIATDFLNYLVARGHANVVTDSRMTQVNGKTAVLRSVTDLPYIVHGVDGDKPASAPVRDSPQAVDADGMIKHFVEGVTVEMTPRIGSDIELAVKTSVSSHVGYTPNQFVPLIADNSIDTVVVLEPNRAAVLGGLSRESNVTERSGIAGLRDIPGLQNIFSHEVEAKRKSQIVITITLDRILNAGPKAANAAVMPPIK